MGNGLRRPKNPVPGTDLAGVVEAVGSTVTRFGVGDEVFGETLRGMQWCNGGAYAELATAPEAALAAKPAEVSFVAAACVPTAGLIVLFNLPDSVGRGSRVLVNGAAGGVGSLAVQIAKARGATVVGVDLGDRVDLALRAGADTVIDAGPSTSPGPAIATT